VFIVVNLYFVIDSVRKLWIHPRIPHSSAILTQI